MSQILNLRDTIVAKIKTLAPKLDVEPHLGRFDEGEMRVFLTKAPAVRVAVLALDDVAPDAAEDTVNPCIRLGLYVVTRDVVATADRTGAALSLVEALVLLCDRQKWGLGSYVKAGRVAGAQLLYSQGIRDAGVALWVIDLRQPIQLTTLSDDEGQLARIFAGFAPNIGAGHQADYIELGEGAHVDEGYFDAERDRRISNVVREGTIFAIQDNTARVQLTEDLVTDFLPVRQVRAGRMRSWSAMVVGEQVSVLSASGETGVGTVLRGLNCAAFAAPSDSADLEIFAQGDDDYLDQYDLAAHVRTVTIPASGQLVVQIGENTKLLITDGQAKLIGASLMLGPDGDYKPVARVGDQVQVGSNVGVITQGSSAVHAS